MPSPASLLPFDAEANWDAIVVGARVAGAATAMLLARQGLDVLVLERAPAPGGDTLSTHALMRGAVLQLARWGLLDAVRDAATPPIRRTTIHYGDQVQIIDIKARGEVDALYAPRRTVLDPILVDAAREAGAELRFGVAVRGLLHEGHRVVGVFAEDARGRTLELRSRIVIGADGARSLVARGAGVTTTWEGNSSGGFLYGYWADLPTDGYEWYYQAGSAGAGPTATGLAGGVIPTNHGETCVWVSCPTRRFLDEVVGQLDGGFSRLFAEVAPSALERLAGARRLGHLRGFPGWPGYLRRPVGPGWALVGDAGSFRDPISAHGITDALRDAELLARAIVASHSLGEDALATYEHERDAVARELAVLSDLVAAFDWTLDELLILHPAMSKAMRPEVEKLEALGDWPVAA